MAFHLMFKQNLISVKFESVIFGMKCTIFKKLENLYNKFVKSVVGFSDNGFQKMEKVNMELQEMNPTTIPLHLPHPTMDMVQLSMLNPLQFVPADKDLPAQLVNLVMMANMEKMEILVLMVKKDKMVKSLLLQKLLNHALFVQQVHLDYPENKDLKDLLAHVEVTESMELMDVVVNPVWLDLQELWELQEKAVNKGMLELLAKLSNVTVLVLPVAQLDLKDLKESKGAQENLAELGLEDLGSQEMKENPEDLAERVHQDLLDLLVARDLKVVAIVLLLVHLLDIKLKI